MGSQQIFATFHGVRRQKEVVEHNHGLPQDHVTSRVLQMSGG
jgi:hypothetical protein